jgi:hypothetical protein
MIGDRKWVVMDSVDGDSLPSVLPAKEGCRRLSW